MEANNSLLGNDLNVLMQYKEVVDVSNIVSKTNLDGKITYANQEFCRISGYTYDELIGQNHNIVKHPDMPSEIFKDLWNTILSKKIWKGTIKNKAKSGNSYFVSTTIVPILSNSQDIIEFISIRHDVTELINLRDKFKEMSIRDYLTGLYNRCYFQSAIADEFERLKTVTTRSFLILFDIDDFKLVNDQFGHDVGDKLLVEITENVKSVIRDKDIFCRIGGDEFAILIFESTVEKAMFIGEKIRKKVVEHTFSYGKKITISVGLTDFNESVSAETLYKRADIALYRSKKCGRNCVERY